MVADPLWDCAGWSHDPDALFFAGAEDIEAQLSTICSFAASDCSRGLGMETSVSNGGTSFSAPGLPFSTSGASRVRRLRQPTTSWALRRVSASHRHSCAVERQGLPFDVEEPPIVLRADGHDGDRLTAAINLAYGRPYHGEEGAGSVKRTLM